MRYILAIFVPPLAILICGKMASFVVNLFFWIVSIPLLFVFGLGAFVWLICMVHAMIVCSQCAADKRLDRLVGAIQARNEVPGAGRAV